MTTQDVVACAAAGCQSRGKAQHLLDLSDGKMTPHAPPGWGEVVAMADNGDELVLFVCSPTCERRLARNLATPRLGTLDP